MDFGNPVVWLVGGLVVVAVLMAVVAPRFSAAARLERRRRKSNSPVISKSQRPTVKFSVRTNKSKK